MTLTTEQAAALDVARGLAAAGIPVFAAAPAVGADGQWDARGGTGRSGYWLPHGWQQTAAGPEAVDAWRPGMALAVVCGHGLDVIDVDPRNGGDLAALDGALPVIHGVAATPSGGAHAFVRSLGVRKGTAAPGIDIQAGAPDGTGRGFVWIAPTIKLSKVTSQPGAYAWVKPPDHHAAIADDGRSGAALAAMVRAKDAPAPGADDFMRIGPWADLEATLSAGRNNGVARLAASLRGRGGLLLEDALDVMYRRVWPVIERMPGDHEFTADEFEATIRAAWKQYPDGAEQRAEEAAIPPDPQAPAANPARYFGQGGGLLAATLAGDVLALGPLAEGIDDRMWRYAGGVWLPDKDVVRERGVALLGEKYKRQHASTAEDIVRAHVGTIASDPVPEVVNFYNGLYRWRTGELGPHAPEVLTTVQLPVEWDPAADCPAFEKFLAEVVPYDMVPVVWELIGYLMYSGNPLHKAVMLTGRGRNGKGTLLRVITALLGRRNITSVSLHDLVNTRFTTASLFGRLANIAGDIDGGFLESTATLKAITGGDMISAEHKGRDRFDFVPWATPVFSANKIPASADTTAGYLSRWLVVPFPHSFEGREDRTLDRRLLDPAELRGIAVRALAVLPALLERGDFETTDSGRAARDEFIRRVDQVRTWLEDCTTPDPEHWIPRTDMYEAYRRWALRDGHRPVRAGEFYDRLEAAGLHMTKRRGIWGFYGARITDQGWGQVDSYLMPGPTSGNGPQGAEGAGNSDSDSEGADQGAAWGAAKRTTTESDSPSAQSHFAENFPAPTLTSGNDAQGAEGAETSLPPRTRVRAHGGVSDLPAPSAPPRSSKSPSKAKIAKEAERAVKIAEAAGAVGTLPAVVLRSGVITSVSLANARAIAWPSGTLTVDVETSGYPVGHEHYALRTVQLGNTDKAVVFDPTDPEQATAVRELLAAAPKLHAHSATADLVPLVDAGLADLSAWDRMHDTVLPALLADPSSTGSDAGGLKELAGSVLRDSAVSPGADAARAELFKTARWLTNTDATTPVERSGWAQVDPRCATMTRYAASDVLDTAALSRALPKPQPAVLDRERTVQRITARVTHRGLLLDGDRVDRLLAEHTAARDGIASRARDEFGIANVGSAQQVGAALLELGVALPRTTTGQPSTADGVLTPLRNIDGRAGDLVRVRLDYQHHKTAISLFLAPYAELVHRGDGRARPTIYTLGTSTGRMSCTRPNLQQLPREGGVRACVTADSGQLLVSADFSSVEVRVMAALSQDPSLIRMILSGVDLHSTIAEMVFGQQYTKANRYITKRGVFGWAYGGGIETLAKQVGTTQAVMSRVVDALAKIAPTYVQWAANLKDVVRQGRTQMPTPAGRVIHLPPDTPHKAPNYAIQGTARELLVDALLRWQDTRWGDSTILPVHDEILTAVPEADAEPATAELVRCMTSELYGVPIAAEASEPSFAWRDAS